MAADQLTAGKIAEALKVPPAAVKKAIASLKIEPSSRKGACCYYGADAVEKIKKAVKN